MKLLTVEYVKIRVEERVVETLIDKINYAFDEN